VCECIVRKNFFAERVVNVWKSLPHDVEFSSLSKFKRSINQVYFLSSSDVRRSCLAGLCVFVCLYWQYLNTFYVSILLGPLQVLCELCRSCLRVTDLFINLFILIYCLTRTAYHYNGCLPWYNVVLTLRVHSSTKYSQQSIVTAADLCDGRINVLNHCLSCSLTLTYPTPDSGLYTHRQIKWWWWFCSSFFIENVSNA